MTPVVAATLLQAARLTGAGVETGVLQTLDRETAFAIQDATLALIGPIGGWKVGAKSATAEPNCAPLPASCITCGPATLRGPAWRMRGIELELAFRLGRDLDLENRTPTPAELRSAFDAVLPAIEVVETRLADWKASDPLVQLADLQSHGALVLGAALTGDIVGEVDLRKVRAQLHVDGQPVADTHAGNPATEVWRLLGWLARHCAQRGTPLRKGQVVTTGSCTGMLFAPPAAAVRGHINGLGSVELRFEP